MVNENIYVIAEKNNIDKKFVDIFVDFTKDMVKMEMIKGGCHLISSMLYIIMNEMGYETVLRLGIAEILNTKFSHSWVEYNNKKFDIAISNTNRETLNICGIIFADIDIDTMVDGKVCYYNMSDSSPDKTGEIVMKMTIGKYYEQCPFGRNFCWDYIVRFCGKYKKYLNTRRVKSKYCDHMWKLEVNS